MITVDRDDFDLWMMHPVTELLMRGLKSEADRAKQAWIDASWDGLRTSEVLLATLKERAALATQLSEMDAATLEKMLNGSDEEN